MSEVILSWEEFETSMLKEMDAPDESRSHLLFRGLPSIKMPLLTTLERITNEPKFSSARYYRQVLTALRRIESFLDKTWNLPEPERADFDFEEMRYRDLRIYEAMAYLRHHGYPSPLLDWSRSPYIAAFFAFWDYQISDDKVIYIYQEYDDWGKSWEGNKPLIVSLGRTIKTDKRHYLQQSEYTHCLQKIDGEIYYVNHEGVFLNERREGDRLRKIILPQRDRKKVLERLLRMNITPFSLFGDEDSLARSEALESFG